MTAKRPSGVSLPGAPTVTANRRSTLSPSRSSALRSETSTTIEVRVQPACSRFGSRRTQPSWPLASNGVLTPAHLPSCLTTPQTVGEPNSVRLPARVTSSPPPGFVRISIR